MDFASIPRPAPLTVADERTTLTQFLDYYRATLATKCAGLSPEQLAERAVPPSSLSLLGLVRHMGEVERAWFRRFAMEDPVEYRYSPPGNPDGDFDDVRPDEECVRDAFEYWQAEIAHAREVTAAHALDDVRPRQRETTRRDFSLRWILVHLIEEYARHCGHADFLRERIDGVTGD